MSTDISEKIGYIPVYNYIIKIKVFDCIIDTNLYLVINDNYRCVTSNFEIIQIIDYLTDKEIDEFEYIIDTRSYIFYGSYQDKLTYSSITRSYKKNNLYTEKRYYYNTFVRALSETYMKYKLYQKYPNGCSGDYTSYKISGAIFEKYYHINGLKEGLYRKYYTDGSLEEEIEYVNGIKHGFLKKYNGKKIDIIEYYSMNILNGLCVYNNLGRLSHEYKVEITYKNGIIDGIYKKYHRYKKGGGLHIECNFKDGKYYGIYKEYDETSNLVMECDYKFFNKDIDIKDLM